MRANVLLRSLPRAVRLRVATPLTTTTRLASLRLLHATSRASTSAATATAAAKPSAAANSSASGSGSSNNATGKPEGKARPSALVWGGRGALGAAMIEKFKGAGWHTVCVDYGANTNADTTIDLNENGAPLPWDDAVALVKRRVAARGAKLGCIVNAAGAWAGERASAAGFIAGADKMLKSNLASSLATVHLASLFLADGGVVVLTGSAVCDAPTPDMLAYGCAKAAVHHLIRSVAAAKPGKGAHLPPGAAIAGILPTTIDTPANRVMMPNGAFDTWTLPQVFASRVLEWADRRQPPVNGGLYVFETKGGSTSIRVLGAEANANSAGTVVDV